MEDYIKYCMKYADCKFCKMNWKCEAEYKKAEKEKQKRKKNKMRKSGEWR